MSTRRKPPSRDPRKAGGSFAGPGGPHDKHGVVVDTGDAVLLDHCGVVLVEPYRSGQAGPPMLGMTLSGRINRTPDRTEILYLFDEDGAAGIITELLALGSRIGEGFVERMLERIDKHGDEGVIGPSGA